MNSRSHGDCPIVKPGTAMHCEQEAWGRWGKEGKMTHATRSTSASIMAPMPGGNRKEQDTVVARKAQGLWKWQSWAGLPLASVILGKFIYF